MHIELLIAVLILLICVSAFFSGSETGMMAINRYRLRHLTRKNNHAAKRVSQLLARPDRLLGVILLGNTFANLMAASVATVIMVHYFGESGVIISTIILTFIILIFAETAPKTLAAMYPQTFAFMVSWPLRILLKIFYPLVWIVNMIANGILTLCRVKLKNRKLDAVNIEELRTIVGDSGSGMSFGHQQLLLRLLDFESVTIEDVIVPRNRIRGIDLSQDWLHIKNQILNAKHTHMPIYYENIDEVAGLLNVRQALTMLLQQESGVKTKQTKEGKANKEKKKTKETKYIDAKTIADLAKPVYYIPESATLTRQLMYFQQRKCFIALVVDEYGDIQGLVTIKDILEEIVGEFVHDDTGQTNEPQRLQDGSYLVDASIPLRDIIRFTSWELPTDRSNTLGGLILDELQLVPELPMCVRIAGYPIEIVHIVDNQIATVRIWPEQRQQL